ncbi:MAG: hypothetical protein JSW27_14700 [Phycisphaerales bacterium]|nr:MAG: hypothetical protein JSW27_14700 [Phycisphaerales bacterium]
MTDVLKISFVRRLSFALVAGLLGSAARGAGPNVVIITATKLEITDKTLELCYEITNGSQSDIWVCEGVGVKRLALSSMPLCDEPELRAGIPGGYGVAV